MVKNQMFDYGIYRPQGQHYDRTDKERNIYNQVNYYLNRTQQMFKWEGLPETVPSKELERILQTGGYAVVTEIEGELYALYGGLGGEPNPYYLPKKATISNPALRYSENLEIYDGTNEETAEAVVIRNDFTFTGLMPLFSKYATLIQEAEITLQLSNINQRADTLISVTDNQTAESAKEYLKKLEQGELGYIMQNKLYDSLNVDSKAGRNETLKDVTEYINFLRASLQNELGINGNTNLKRERMITDEVEQQGEGNGDLVANMFESRLNGIEDLKAVFDIDVSIDFGGSWKKQKEDKAIDVLEEVETDDSTDSRITESESGIEETESEITETESGTDGGASESSEGTTQLIVEPDTEEPTEKVEEPEESEDIDISIDVEESNEEDSETDEESETEEDSDETNQDIDISINIGDNPDVAEGDSETISDDDVDDKPQEDTTEFDSDNPENEDKDDRKDKEKEEEE